MTFRQWVDLAQTAVLVILAATSLMQALTIRLMSANITRLRTHAWQVHDYAARHNIHLPTPPHPRPDEPPRRLAS